MTRSTNDTNYESRCNVLPILTSWRCDEVAHLALLAAHPSFPRFVTDARAGDRPTDSSAKLRASVHNYVPASKRRQLGQG
eukprot:6197478-Pleurochrysis_carterae.AAC.1